MYNYNVYTQNTLLSLLFMQYSLCHPCLQLYVWIHLYAFDFELRYNLNTIQYNGFHKTKINTTYTKAIIKFIKHEADIAYSHTLYNKRSQIYKNKISIDEIIGKKYIY